MSFKETLQKEKYVVVHGQSKKFRIVKYSIIIPILLLLGFWKGWKFSLYFILLCAGLGIILHFVLRYKTKGWTEKWGPVDPLLQKDNSKTPS